MRIAAVLAACAGLVVAVSGCGGSCDCGPTAAAAVAATPGRTLSIAIDVVKHGGQVIALVPVTIQGQGPFTFALDTGASQSLVDKQVAAKLHVRGTGRAEKVAGVSSIGRGIAIRISRWQVGDVKLPATTVIAANLPFGNAVGGVQGLLGSDMLSGFDVVTIDYDHQVLRLHPRASG